VGCIARLDVASFIPGDANGIEITGSGFGTLTGYLNFSPAVGYSITSWNPTAIRGILSIPDTYGGQQVTASVVSGGTSPSGFAPAPEGGSSQLSNSVAFAIITLLISQSPAQTYMTTGDQGNIDVIVSTPERVRTSGACQAL
jgi:hypothetical protein